MKKLVLVAALGLSAINMTAQAATTAQNFNVTATLTTNCVTNTTGVVAFGTYTAFGAAITAPSMNVTFNCTRGLAIPVAAISLGAVPGLTGSIAGLNYSLTLATGVKTPGTGSNPDVFSYAIGGSMAAGQAGDVTASTAPVVHTLTITY